MAFSQCATILVSRMDDNQTQTPKLNMCQDACIPHGLSVWSNIMLARRPQRDTLGPSDNRQD